MILTHHSSPWPWRFTVALLMAPVLMFLPGCSSRGPFGQESGHVYSPPAPAEIKAALRDQSPATEGRVSMRGPVNPSSRVRVADMKTAATGFRPTFEMVTYNPGELIDPCDGCPPGVTFCPAEERLDPSCCGKDMCDIYPDEYLVDGCDRDLPVHYYGGSRQGFDTEDTIAEYSDHSGTKHVKKSNRVCVYSPRFGSVRVIEGAGMDVQVNGVIGRTDVTAVGLNHAEQSVDASIRQLPPGGFQSRRRADGAEANTLHEQADQLTRLSENRRFSQGIEGIGRTGSITSEQLLSPELEHQLANAVIWTRELYPVLSASTTQATQIRARFHAEAVIGIDDQAKESEIRIVKLADCSSAEAGDIIHFTIRYFNTGDYDLNDVQIVDNLTPRLHFIPDSAQTSHAGEVLTEDNGEGSQVLTFVLDKPLKGRESGTIEFDVRVK